MPLILGFIVLALIAGILVSVLGYYTSLMIASSITMPIAIGLLSTFTPSTPSPQWIGYQALFGLGVGCGIQQPLLVIQTVLPEIDVPVGTSLITMTQALFGAIFVAVAQNVFDNALSMNIHSVAPDFNIQGLLNGGATTIIADLPASIQPLFLAAYNKSVTETFYVAVALGALSIVGAMGTEWRSVKETKKLPEVEGKIEDK